MFVVLVVCGLLSFLNKYIKTSKFNPFTVILVSQNVYIVITKRSFYWPIKHYDGGKWFIFINVSLAYIKYEWVHCFMELHCELQHEIIYHEDEIDNR